MARSRVGPVALGVAMTGGHGEWFVQRFDADGTPAGQLASLRPEAAAAAIAEEIVAGNQAEALVAARGHGQALALLPDARELALLPADQWIAEARPIYGRPPDARLPGAALGTSPAPAA
jgi:hypothetical protein